MAANDAQGEITGNVPMYRRPEPLNVEMHKGLGVNPSEAPFGFVATLNAVPLQVAEFGMAAVHYPIIFGGEGKQPLAVLGIRGEENLFVDEKGAMEPGAYVPAFVRRYPFVLANDERAQRLIVCIDRDAENLVDGGKVQLFENGEASEFTKNAIKFCEEFENERLRTESFVKLLAELDLFDTRQTHFTPTEADGSPGQPVAISEYFAVTEERLGRLSADKLKELRDNGALGQIFAHLISLNTWDKMMVRAMARGPLGFTPAAVVRN